MEVSPNDIAELLPRPWQYLPHTFANVLSSGLWIPFSYAVLISHVIVTVLAAGNARVTISLPPRHGKSEFISKWVPAWYLCNWPEDRVILASYEATFASTWGRKVRDMVKEFGPQFGTGVSDATGAASSWETLQGGGMVTAGAGGPITGKGMNLGLIDDPHKNWAEAMSMLICQRIWDWFDSTFYTRLEPNGSIVILHCMTGDTRVLMSDGTEKDLKDIRSGDQVATYKDGQLTESKVLNWTSNGFDKVFTIKTTSGITVKANERHPFLTYYHGGEKWTRVRDLCPGHEIYRVNGANGKARPVLKRDVTIPQSVADTAYHTTTKSYGLRVFGSHQLKQLKRLVTNLSTVMASHWNNTKKCFTNKTDVVQSVSAMLQKQITPSAGKKDCASIIVTILEKLGHSFVTIATCFSNESLMFKSSKTHSNTSSFILDKIESITYAGEEEVFDVQIAETENFIANQLVSHNTRWTENDLIGWIQREKTDENWIHIRLPAIAEVPGPNEPEDLLGRTPGEALCPERYDIKRLIKIRDSLGARIWAGLYQQRPAAMEGNIWKRDDIRYYNSKVIPQINFVLQSWDTGFKKTGESAYSVCQTWGVGPVGAVLLDQWREKVEYPELERQVATQYYKHRPHIILIEDKASGQSLIQSLQRNTNFPVVAVPVTGDKVIRAVVTSPMFESHRVWIPEQCPEHPYIGEMVNNWATFPNGTYADETDTASQALFYIMNMAISGGVVGAVPRRGREMMAGFNNLLRLR